MTTKELMDRYKRSLHTVTIWRRGYYIRSYRGKVSVVWLLPDHSKIPCKWITDPETKRKRWEYDPVKTAVWLKRLEDYRKSRKTVSSKK